MLDDINTYTYTNLIIIHTTSYNVSIFLGNEFGCSYNFKLLYYFV